MAGFEVVGPREIAGGVWFYERVLPDRWSFGMTLVRLPGGGLLVHSATWLGDDTKERLERLGRPAVLLAPNQFHGTWLAPFRRVWPEALPVASTKAAARLARKGNAGVRHYAEAAALLPEGASFLEPAGLKNGEVWPSIPTPEGRVWIVCDALHQRPGPTAGVRGAFLKLFGVREELSVSRIFRLGALRDRGAWLAWLRDAVARERPACVLLSHGREVRGTDAGDRLVAAVERWT